MTRAFCSRLAEAGHGVIAGTGVHGDIYVFLPVDKKRWGEREFNGSWATAEELDAIRRARKAGVIVRLYDPPPEGPPGRILVHRGPSPAAGAVAGLEQLTGALRRLAWEVDDSGAPRLALCTQGTRDRCCAKWGFAVAREAMRLHAAGQLPFEPIECSHLGGDRFAATGIVFPSGGMYGHLDRLPLAELAAAETEGRILHDHYRGRVFDPPLVQVVRAGLARDGFEVTAVSALSLAGPAPAEGPITAIAAGRSYEVVLSRREFRFFGDCEAVAKDRPSREMRVVYESARPIEG